MIAVDGSAEPSAQRFVGPLVVVPTHSFWCACTIGRLQCGAAKRPADVQEDIEARIEVTPRWRERLAVIAMDDLREARVESTEEAIDATEERAVQFHKWATRSVEEFTIKASR